MHGKDFVAGYGAEGYRANVRTFIKRIRKKFRDCRWRVRPHPQLRRFRLPLDSRRGLSPHRREGRACAGGRASTARWPPRSRCWRSSSLPCRSSSTTGSAPPTRRRKRCSCAACASRAASWPRRWCRCWPRPSIPICRNRCQALAGSATTSPTSSCCCRPPTRRGLLLCRFVARRCRARSSTGRTRGRWRAGRARPACSELPRARCRSRCAIRRRAAAPRS